jgi:hypothetical protein
MYYAGPSQWTAERKSAVSFDQLKDAEEFAKKSLLQGAEMILTARDANGETIIPLPS